MRMEIAAPIDYSVTFLPAIGHIILRQDLQITSGSKPEGHEIELKFLTSESGFKSSQKWPVLGPAAQRRGAQRLIMPISSAITCCFGSASRAGVIS
jgi:hypothetical protein